MAKKLVYLSPSNHGKNQNPCLKKGCYEDKHTRPMAEATAKYLKASGFDVIIGKTTHDMRSRCAEADRKGAVLYVPIHSNAAGSAARFLEFMCINLTGEYKKLYNAIAPQMEAIYPGKLDAHFSKRMDLYEINTPKAKTFYCEMGFHTNKVDCDSFIHNPEAIGKALAKGICKYFGVKFKAPTEAADFAVKTKGKLIVRKAASLQSEQVCTTERGAKLVIVKVDGNRGKLGCGKGWITITDKYVDRV